MTKFLRVSQQKLTKDATSVITLKYAESVSLLVFEFGQLTLITSFCSKKSPLSCEESLSAPERFPVFKGLHLSGAFLRHGSD